jgi:1,2-diacylglycerol 3-alpha-glucosyltransferase
MNIGFFADCWEPQINGVVVSMKNLKTALEHREHRVYTYAPVIGAEKRTSEDVFRQRAVTYPFQKEFFMASPLFHKALRRARGQRIDIVHGHTEFSLGLVGAAVARHLCVPFVFTLHTLWKYYSHYFFWGLLPQNLLSALLRRFYLRPDYYVAPSTKIKSYLEKEFRINAHIETIPTGLDLTPFSRPVTTEERCAFRRRHHLREDDIVMIFAGRLGREKSINLLLQALPPLLIRHPRLKLLLVGDGPAREELELLALALGVRPAVAFTGYLRGERMALAYRAADFYVIASTTESQGLVTVEAMASGLPAVVREDIAGIDILGDRANGLVWKDQADFARAIDTLLTRPALEADLRKRSLARACAFTLEKFGERMEAFYAWAVDDYRRRRCDERTRGSRRRKA